MNWDDDSTTPNLKSDRRDSGIPKSSVVLRNQTDPDFNVITYSIAPEGITTGSLVFSFAGERQMGGRDIAAIWEDNKRTGDRIRMTSQTAIQISDLPTSYCHEAVYPNSLNTSGTITGILEIRAAANIEGGQGLTTHGIQQYLNANNTYYTLIIEDEYASTITTATETLTAYFDGTENTTTSTVITNFKNAVGIQGSGLLTTPVVVVNGGTTTTYPYLRYLPDPADSMTAKWYWAESVLTASGHVLTDTATAKWWFKYVRDNDDGTTTLVTTYGRSAIDKVSNIHIPLLRDNISQGSPDMEWLANLIPEDRVVNDGGDGGGEYDKPEKWIDIFVGYVPTNQRPQSCQSHKMIELLGGDARFIQDFPDLVIPRIENLQVWWVEQ